MKSKKTTWKWVLSDINSIVKSVHTIPGAVGNLFQHYKHSEINPDNYESGSAYANMILTPIIPTTKVLKSKTDYDGTQKVKIENEDIVQDESVWFFINGIATSPELSKVNGKKIAEVFKREIHLLYNPSDSIPFDLIECIMDRTFKMGTKVTDSIYEAIITALENYNKVVVLSHSQGGIIVAEIVNRLVNDEKNHELAEKLEVYTFASAANYMEKHDELTEEKKELVPYMEHFANTKDFISRIGILHYKDEIEGYLYTNNSSGHLLNIHYLVQFLNGDFGKTNKLFKYIPTNTDKDAEINDLKSQKAKLNDDLKIIDSDIINKDNK